MVMSFKWTLQGCVCISAIAVEAGTVCSLASLYAAFQILKIIPHLTSLCGTGSSREFVGF